MVENVGRITLWGVEVFVATAEESSISAAARRLAASPSAVSQQLTNLETALGAVLIDRSARPLTLTPAGTLFLKRAQTILNEAAQARAELATGALSQQMRLRIGVIEDFDADVTPRLLTNLADTRSGAQFLLETGASHRLYDQLDARALDLIIAADLGTGADWMEVYPLMQEPFVAAIPKDGDFSDPFTELPLVQYTARHHMGRMISDHLVRHNLRPDQRFELDSYHAIMSMVAKGVGWTILTPLGYFHAQRFCADTTLVELPFAPLKRQISLVCRKDVWGGLPAEIAEDMKAILQELVIGPATTTSPWLQDRLTLL